MDNQVKLLRGQSGQAQMYKTIIRGTRVSSSGNGPCIIAELSNSDLGRGGVWRQISAFASRGLTAWISLEFSNHLYTVFTSK